ncbi:defective proboscis extension response 17 [Musca autumnalis]|uniref:defective proboscis extension response 17 n=1 Tax=Musca autumnalis TaxID=221902 RepID=UPI003CEF2BAF
MNFYRSLTRTNNTIKTKETTKKATTTTLETNVPEEPVTVAEVVAAALTTITSGTNVETTTTSPPTQATDTATAAPTVTTSVSAATTLADKSFIFNTLPSGITAQNCTCHASHKHHHCCCSTNAINCCCNSQLQSPPTPNTMSYKNKKNANEERFYSRRMCCSSNKTKASQAVATDSVTPEVMPPAPSLTSMSAEQISLTSRVNVMAKETKTANQETTKTATTANMTSRRRKTGHHKKQRQDITRKLPSPSLLLSTSSSSSSASSSTFLTCKLNFNGGSDATACRSVYQNIKMPLRRLMLTIMAAVVLSTEFTICSSSSVLEQRLKTISVVNTSHSSSSSSGSSSNSRQIPAETTNKSYKITESLPNLPVTLTTLTTTTVRTTLSQAPGLHTSSSSFSSQSSSLPVAEALASAVASMSGTSISTSTEKKSSSSSSLKTLETAALSEPLPSPSAISSASPALPESPVAIETVEKSPFSSFSLTATTQIENEPFTLDDFNASSELLSGPTSILNTHDSSDLPPLTEAEQAAKDLLTKGFSIPTYLPPFPVFAVADLPAYLNMVSSTTTEAPPSNHHMSPDDMSSLENLLFFDNKEDRQQQLNRRRQQQQHRKLQIPRRNSSTIGPNNVTVQEGSHAYLPCRIHRLQNKPVSWVRLRDGHIISVDQTTFIADQRFQAIFQDDKEYTWSLQIKYVQPSDEGWFECQASSEPKMSAKVYLKVIVPLTELIGDQSRFVKAGSKVALHCIVRGTLDPPQYIIWYRDKTQISDDNKLGWYTQLDRNIFGNNGDNENTIGSLIIPSVRKVDSGNYTCQPSNSASVSVDLHVLSGEYSASAIMSAARTYALNDAYLLILLLLMLLHNT